MDSAHTKATTVLGVDCATARARAARGRVSPGAGRALQTECARVPIGLRAQTRMRATAKPRGRREHTAHAGQQMRTR
eukprot:13972251-Alexandrium_andersonii.AAC.1